ncbi:unnamed protein product [Echinostoma caproni]|uniref:PET domain-containing protein n=1 Tax=Echinostoma caproni TaxID=27848 RepID=A0A183A8S7_9TREM|nr:unnamed protein product [Echinostoma caproni]
MSVFTHKRSKLIPGRIFGKRSNSAKQSPVQPQERKLKPCFSCDCPSGKLSGPTSWEMEGSTEDELIFIFPDRPRLVASQSDPEDDKQNLIMYNPPRAPADRYPPETDRLDRPSQAVRRICGRVVSPQEFRDNMNERSRLTEPITTQMRLMRTQNVWCIPDLSRSETEHLLAPADPGVSLGKLRNGFVGGGGGWTYLILQEVQQD